MSEPVPLVPVSVGDVVRVAEEDYCYGSGELILRVTEIGSVQLARDGAWINVRGTQLRSDGAQVDAEPRLALVRLSALRRQRRLQRRG
jgi:hypothetical protein